MQSRTLGLLEQRGLVASIVAKGNPAVSTTIYGEGRALGKVDLTRIPSRYNFCLLLAQSETEGLLRQQLAQQVALEWQRAWLVRKAWA